MLHLTASHSSYIPYYFNLFSIISSLYSSAIMSRILCGSVLQQVTYSRPTVQGNGGTPIFALKWVCRTDTNIELPHCSYRQIE